MEKQPKVSVIIPVYNVEQYLSRCLDSVISQNFNDMEIICINDGSKDASLRILEEYAGKDSRIVIIDKKMQEFRPPGMTELPPQKVNISRFWTGMTFGRRIVWQRFIRKPSIIIPIL